MTSHSLFNLNDQTAALLSPNGIHSGLDFTIQNVNQSGYIYLGGDATVSSTNYGFRIYPNQAISFELPGKDAIYAISSAPNMKAAVIYTALETGQ